MHSQRYLAKKLRNEVIIAVSIFVILLSTIIAWNITTDKYMAKIMIWKSRTKAYEHDASYCRSVMAEETNIRLPDDMETLQTPYRHD